MTRLAIIVFVIISFLGCSNKYADSHAKASNRDFPVDSQVVDKEANMGNNDKIHLDYLNENEAFLPEDSIAGIGILTLSENADTYNKTISLYDAQGKNLVSIKQQEEDVITVFNGKTYHNNDTTNPFMPRLYATNSDYFRLAFDCVGMDKDFYEVIINTKTKQLGKIKKKDKVFELQSIEKFVGAWTTLGFDFNRSENPLRKSPNDDAEIIRHDTQSKYKIWNAAKISIKKDWLEVEIEDTNEKGWIRWRKGNKILIQMYYAC
jgi:hypothetical protein